MKSYAINQMLTSISEEGVYCFDLDLDPPSIELDHDNDTESEEEFGIQSYILDTNQGKECQHEISKYSGQNVFSCLVSQISQQGEMVD